MVGRFITTPSAPSDSSRVPRRSGLPAFATSAALLGARIALTSNPRLASLGLPLGVGDALDQVVAALIGRDLTGQGLLDLDVQLVGPWKVPGLVKRGHDSANVGRLVPHLENGVDVTPRCPSALDGIALHDRVVAGAEHRIFGKVDSLRVLTVLGLASEILQQLPGPFLVAI